MLWRGMKTRATSFTRSWCLTNLTFCSAFQGLLYSSVTPRPSSSGALSLGQLHGSQQVKHPKWQIKILPLCRCLWHATCYAVREKKPLRTRWPSGLCKKHPIKDPNTGGNLLSYELASTCSSKSSSGESKDKQKRPFSHRISEPPLFSLEILLLCFWQRKNYLP